jgi:cytoskeletal protein RodZ
MVTVMPHSLGQFLKEARTRQGLTLETIAERTRINLSHLRALEENDFSKLPPLIFARAYLKEYTRCLSLQESQQADLMVRFAESAGAYYSRKQVATEKPHKRTWGSSFKLSR